MNNLDKYFLESTLAEHKLPAFDHKLKGGKLFTCYFNKAETSTHGVGDDVKWLQNGYFSLEKTSEYLNKQNDANSNAYMKKDLEEIDNLKVGETWESPYSEYHKIIRAK
jgi:hypothetical protein